MAPDSGPPQTASTEAAWGAPPPAESEAERALRSFREDAEARAAAERAEPEPTVDDLFGPMPDALSAAGEGPTGHHSPATELEMILRAPLERPPSERPPVPLGETPMGLTLNRRVEPPADAPRMEAPPMPPAAAPAPAPVQARAAPAPSPAPTAPTATPSREPAVEDDADALAGFEDDAPDLTVAPLGVAFQRRRRPPARTLTRKEKKQLGALRARKVRRMVRHLDPWSVLKLSLAFYLCLFVVVLVAGTVLWGVASAAGTIENIESFIKDIGAFKSFEFDGWRIFRASLLGGLVLVIIGAGVNVLLAVLFNLISDLVGGLEVTVVEQDSAVPL